MWISRKVYLVFVVQRMDGHQKKKKKKKRSEENVHWTRKMQRITQRFQNSLRELGVLSN